MNFTLPRLILIGAGGHARSLLSCIGLTTADVAYADPRKASDAVLGNLWHIGDDHSLRDSEELSSVDAIIAAGVGADVNLRLRRKLIDFYGSRPFATIVATTAFVARSAMLGDGTAVMNMAAVNACTVMGRHCVVNTAAVIEHDCKIGENVFIGPGAVVCGGVVTGDDVFIGAHATIRPGVRICSGAIIVMGAAVVADITVPGVYAGVPATKMQNI